MTSIGVANQATPGALGDLDWDKDGGLLPAIVQDAGSGRVLMLGYMSPEALAETLRSRQVTFFSRSRQALWRKGASSGNVLDLVGVQVDCDRDALLVRARPRGPTCHMGTVSCFDAAASGEAVSVPGEESTMPVSTGDPITPRPVPGGSMLAHLDALIERRERERPAGRYTTALFEGGVRRMAQKVGEEGVETALAAVAQDDAALLGEAADLAYHLLVLLRARGLGLADLEAALQARAG